MIFRGACAGGLLFAAVSVWADGTSQTAPTNPGAPTPAVPKKEEPLKIPGLVINRADGRFLGLEIEDNRFKLSFYTAKKKPMPADVARGTARWAVHYQPGDERTVLNPAGDGTSLVSLRPVRPPHVFKIYLSLFAEGNEEPVESYVVDYHD